MTKNNGYRTELETVTSALNNKYDRTDFLYSDITNIDLNTITIPGNYISHNYSKALNYPYFISDDIIEEDCILKVNTDTSSDLIIQELEIGKYSNFRRVYKDGSWQGWIQTNGISINENISDTTSKDDTYIYVNKNGDDNNSGLSWDDALLTVPEAIRRINICSPNIPSGNFVIRVGYGVYDSLDINFTPGLLSIEGYDPFNIDFEYPQFPEILIKDMSNVSLSKIHADLIECSYGSLCRCNDINIYSVRARYLSTVHISSIIRIVPAKFDTNLDYTFDIYTNSRMFIQSSVIFEIPNPVQYTQFIRILENSEVATHNLFNLKFLNPENLTTNIVFYVSEGGKFISDRSGVIDLSPYFPINYTSFVFCGNNGWFNNGSMSIHQAVSSARSNANSNGFIHSYIDANEEDGTVSKTNYSSWNIWPHTLNRDDSKVRTHLLSAISYRKYTNMSSNVSILVNKNLGTSSGQSVFSIGWTLNDNDELIPFANCPAYKGDGTIGRILTIADSPVYITEFGGDNTAWYKKYSNGFIEQGGIVSNYATQSVTLPIAMTNTNYSIFCQVRNNTKASNGEGNSRAYATSTTTIFVDSGSSGTEKGYFWYVCGY